MIWRLRTRRDFSRLAAQGTRVRAGVLWCTYLLDPPEPSGTGPQVLARPQTLAPPRVAFALGRALGSAVVRNQVRRRLRAILQAESAAGNMPAGMYLFGAQPAAASRSFVELQFDARTLLSRVRG